MNERNVVALEEILDRYMVNIFGIRRLIAEHLATHGVLVPSALTRAEAAQVIGLCSCSEGNITEEVDAVAPLLEQIAREDTVKPTALSSIGVSDSLTLQKNDGPARRV